MRTLKEELKKDLKANRYNFTDLAKESNVSASYLSLVISGKRTPSVKTAKRIARATSKLTGLNYTPSHFINEEL